MWSLQAFVITADTIRDEANDNNKCLTCDRVFRDAAERQQFLSKQVCHNLFSYTLVGQAL